MDLPCNCLGVATAARVPVKRYNFLVPSVYRAEKDISLGKPSGPGVDRSIKKLGEYLNRNPHRVPKVPIRYWLDWSNSVIPYVRELSLEFTHRPLGVWLAA